VTCVAQTFEQDYRTRARDLFLTVERTARLRTTHQDLEIGRIYCDVWPVLETEMLMSFNGWAAPNTVDEGHLTPKELAAAYEQQGGWPFVAEAARKRCRRLLGAHSDLIERLVREDLGSTDRKQLQRGLRAAGQFHLDALYDAVAATLVPRRISTRTPYVT
jgi:hypothetical protein